MTRMRLEGITVLADDVQGLCDFFEGALGFDVDVREPDYVALANDGVRLAIFRRAGMGAHTHGHPSFTAARSGQAFELNFECTSADEVSARYAELVSHGATDIAAPVLQDWGHFTGFFGDPEGNIHSLFAVVS
jgi:uncharacterized glyoxalase superfamily protein PhnB